MARKTSKPRFGGEFQVRVTRQWAGAVAELGDIDDPGLLKRLSQKSTKLTIVGA